MNRKMKTPRNHAIYSYTLDFGFSPLNVSPPNCITEFTFEAFAPFLFAQDGIICRYVGISNNLGSISNCC